MILGGDGKKLSKRHGATSVEEYRDRGYLPDTMVNFLALLGWSLDGETTIIPRDVLCREFSLERITKKDAVFDETKLNWMNGQYIQHMGASEWLKAARSWLVQAGATEADIDADPERFMKMYALVAERLQRFDELPEKLAYLFWGPEVTLDEKSVKKVLLKEGARAEEALRAARDIIADESIAWECDPLQDTVRGLCEKLDMKAKFVFQPIRVAICGNMVSPPLFESVELMDRADVVARIDTTLKEVFGA
jgi:glutamyl-tRNA synthetase